MTYEQVLKNMRRKYNQSERVKEWIPTDLPTYSETDSGYSSERGSVCESKYTPSDSGWSRDTPPYFKEERKDDTIATSSTQKIIEAALKETLSSPVRVVVSLVVVVAVLYFAFNFFSRETVVKHELKIVLQSSSGEETRAEVMEKLLNQLTKQLKQEEETTVHAESQAERDKNQAAKLKAKPRVESQAKDTGFFYHLFAVCYGLVVFVTKLFCGFIVLCLFYGLYVESAKLFDLTRHSNQ